MVLSSQNSHISYVESPLPSPGLPSIVPRHGKAIPSKWPRMMRRLLCWVAGVGVILVFTFWSYRIDAPSRLTGYLPQDDVPYGIVGSDFLPQDPSPVIVTDQHGRSRWTVSIPLDRASPLSQNQYADMCSKSMEISRYLEDVKSRKHDMHHAGHHGYYYDDPNYMDIDEAQNHRLLPDSRDTVSNVVGGEVYSDKTQGMKICKKSLTFVLQSEDAGLGATLMGLWMSYGLAEKEGRAFFIDDTNWPYGDYTSYFQRPSMPSCLPPSPSQKVPCPHQARHLLVTSSTTYWTFGHSFNEQFEDAHKMGVERQRPIFNLLRSGYKALFRLTGQDPVYLNKRVTELDNSVRSKGGLLVGIHVRRGDLHPFEFRYHNSYTPLEVYKEAADRIVASFSSNNSGITHPSHTQPSLEILASDDPDVYTAGEMTGVEKAQFRISLASKTALDASTAAQGGDRKTMDGNIGWEGGFFKDLFWSLGVPFSSSVGDSPPPSKHRQASLAAHSIKSADLEYFRFHPTSEALYLRELIGRAYLLDLAVLGQSDAVVCGVSSIACRILAVIMGWENAIEKGGWNNVDGKWHWKGIMW